jgi:ketosteroid isomerase-like protein
MTDPLSEPEILRLRTLLEVEAIRQLRIDYSLAMDLRDLNELIKLFCDDALCEYGPYGSWEGKQVILDNYRLTFSGDLEAPFTSLHINTNHNVEILSDSHATGQCYLTDIVTHKAPEENPILWFALYDEEYRKEDEQWKFSRTSLQFFWPERHATPPYSK